MTEFYHDYVAWLVERFLKKHLHRHRQYIDTNEVIRKLSKLAFANFVQGARITENMVCRVMNPAFKVLEAQMHLMVKKPYEVEFKTFGLLTKDIAVNRRQLYHFKEALVCEYLVARYILGEYLKRMKPHSPSKTGILTSPIYACLKCLPATGDVWRMVFALLNDDTNTRDLQGPALSELIDISKRVEGMNSFDVTSLCIEAIYESKNAALLTDHIHEFTLNETINYSSAFVPRSRRLYAVSAVGYFVRASDSVYGLHLSNFGLTPERVDYLADPVNEVSDNHLQVRGLLLT